MTIRNMAFSQSAYRNMMVNRAYGNQSINRLAGGLKINSAADNAAGLAISEGMRGQIRGLDQAYQNTQNSISMAQTAEGGLSSTGDILQRMRDLAVQSSNGTYSSQDREQLNKEFNSLKSELDRISDSTNYNGTRLLDGTLGGTAGAAGMEKLGIDGVSASGNLSGEMKLTISEENGVTSITARMGDQSVTQALEAGDQGATFDFGNGNTVSLDFANGVGGLTEGVTAGVSIEGGRVDLSNAVSASNADGVSFQIGAGGSADQMMSLSISDMSAKGLGVDQLDIGTADGAMKAIDALTKAVDQNSGMRGTLGAAQNRLASAASNLAGTRVNLTKAESQIRDLDMAKEMMNVTRRSLMMNASQSVMAQSMNLARGNMMALLMR